MCNGRRPCERVLPPARSQRISHSHAQQKAARARVLLFVASTEFCDVNRGLKSAGV
jgi:hypothetical protein